MPVVENGHLSRVDRVLRAQAVSARSVHVRRVMTPVAANALSSRARRVLRAQAVNARSVHVRRVMTPVPANAHSSRARRALRVQVASARSVHVRRVMTLVAANAHSSRARRALRVIARAGIARSVENPVGAVRREANLLVVSRAAVAPLVGDLRVAGLTAASVRHATGAKPCGLSAGALAGGR